MDDTDLLGLEDCIKSFSEFAVIIINQAAKCLLSLLDSPHVLASLLSHPLSIWMSGEPGKVDASGADFSRLSVSSPHRGFW